MVSGERPAAENSSLSLHPRALLRPRPHLGSHPSEFPEVRIAYLRPPDRTTSFRQRLVHDGTDVKVTLAEGLDVDPPLRIHGRPVLERGSSAIWFTFPGAWHDIGRFYLADGKPTGLYANLITPCVFDTALDWQTTDLFLDLWIPEGGDPRTPHLLDADELDEAVLLGHLSLRLAETARQEADSLLRRAATGAWPPPVVGDWTLDSFP